MPGKRRVLRKGGRRKGGTKFPPSDFDSAPLGDLLSEQASLSLSEQAQSINCRICNTDLVHLNFEWPSVPTHAITLGAVKNAVRQRHGGAVSSVTLYKNFAHPEHLIEEENDGTTLADLGIQGVIPGGEEAVPTITVHYDFPAETQHYDSPLVYMPPNVTAPRNEIPADELKRKLVAGMVMRPGSWAVA
mmetsp:Transcript_32696/g.58548  ORF Transcript_32696/g.58548 Transcript_32696/m.58548 type:complete len:189 (+) Transcript_32696:268-834(+)